MTLTSDDSSITATITNPNGPYVVAGYTRTCSLGIGIAGSVEPFENPNWQTTRPDPTDATIYPQAGQTVTITRDNLPQGRYSLSGTCGQLASDGGWLWQYGQLSDPVTYEIWVGPEPKPEPAGSLMFGS
ncbi:hypothetical protein LCL87_14950 [Rhodococcus hoagii]|nr:hypothetical protein [Prescottella equi]